MGKNRKESTIVIKVNYHTRDPEFIKQLEKNPSRIWEDKRFKKPKHREQYSI